MDFRILMLRQGGKVESRPMYTKVSVLYTPINRPIFRKWARRVLPWFETHQIIFSLLRYTTSYSYLFIYIPVTAEVSWFLWKMDSKRFDVVCYQDPIIQHPVSSLLICVLMDNNRIIQDQIIVHWYISDVNWLWILSEKVMTQTHTPHRPIPSQPSQPSQAAHGGTVLSVVPQVKLIKGPSSTPNRLDLD